MATRRVDRPDRPQRSERGSPAYARVVVAGATGLVGRALLARLVADPKIATAHALIRHKSQAQGLPGGVTPRVLDVAVLANGPAARLPAVDWAFCCLGTTIRRAGSPAAFRALDFDAVLGFARAAQAAGASRLAVVSAMGADPESVVFYSRVKGELEQALEALALPRLVIARPALLLGNRAALGQPIRPVELFAQAMMPAVGWMLPRRLRPISADAVAGAMLRAMHQPLPALQVLESDALQDLAAGD